MKKSIRIALSAMFSIGAIYSASAANTGTLYLQGVIDSNLSLSVDPVVGVHNELNLTQDASELKVATLTENSNSPSGYKILVRSDNGGKLNHESIVGEFVPYSLTVGSATITPTQNNQVAKTVSTWGVQTNNSDVDISYTGSNNLNAGTYSDTVTFTIQAN